MGPLTPSPISSLYPHHRAWDYVPSLGGTTYQKSPHLCYEQVCPFLGRKSRQSMTKTSLSFVLSQVTGFFKGLSFPLASITLYNSLVFGFFSNTQRLISRYRYGDGRHPCSMLDLTVASMLTGLVSVGVGAPVDLVKIRLQLQTQPVLAGKLDS